MNPNARYIAVGCFLLLGVVSVVVLILWFGDRGYTTPTTRYSVEIDAAVNGLSNGSAVRFLGVDVGSVADIRLQTMPAPHVEVVIEIPDTVRVDDATYATLAVQGITGIANIDLGSDPEKAAPMARGPDGLLVIPYRATGLSAVLRTGGNITAAAEQLVVRLNAWSSQGNLERLTAILANLEKVTGAVAAQSHQIPEIVGTLRDAAKRIDHTAALLDTAMAADLPVIAGDLRTVSAHLASASTRVDALLTNNEASLNRLLGEGSTSITEIAAELRDTVADLSALANEVEENPSRLIYRARQDPVVAEP